MVDCFLIGHNEMEISKQLQLFRMSYGENSFNYRERKKYNLASIKYNKKTYSVPQIYELFYGEDAKRNIANPFNITNSFSLGIAVLGTYLSKQGLTIDFINSFNDEKQELEVRLQQNEIGTVGILTTYYLSALPIKEIIAFIKKINSRVKIIVGGPFVANQVSSLGEVELQKLFESLNADIYICSCEGEYTLAETVKAVKAGSCLERVPNIYYKDKHQYIFTRTQKEENDLNANLVDWSLFHRRLGSNVNIRTSMSCPFSCIFCSFPKSAGKYRVSKIETIEKELDAINEMGNVTGFSFIDDTFNFPSARCKEILRMMIKKKYKFKWSSFFRCQHADREMVELMKESGCIQVFCGIESGNQTILNNLNKQATVEMYRQGLALLNEYEIMSVASVFVGFPGETYSTYLDTVNLIEEIKPTFVQSRLWWYDHNAPIYNYREQYQLQGNGYNWSHATMDSATAMDLTDQLVLNIKNSIHLTEYPIPFNLLNSGYEIERIKQYLYALAQCIKESVVNSNLTENSPELIHQLQVALK